METNNCVEIQKSEKDKIRVLLKDLVSFEPIEIIKRGWFLGGTDDICIFDSDASNLALAMQELKCETFFVSPTDQIISNQSKFNAYTFPATKNGIELFQHPTWLDLNINDCLIFDVPVSFAVLRTGGVEYTLYAGQLSFLKTALGLSDD